MVDQVLHFARELRDVGRRVTNVVFMGMGEPFLNYDETLGACQMCIRDRSRRASRATTPP